MVRKWNFTYNAVFFPRVSSPVHNGSRCRCAAPLARAQQSPGALQQPSTSTPHSTFSHYSPPSPPIYHFYHLDPYKNPPGVLHNLQSRALSKNNHGCAPKFSTRSLNHHHQVYVYVLAVRTHTHLQMGERRRARARVLEASARMAPARVSGARLSILYT